jgi:hypothetical protein
MPAAVIENGFDDVRRHGQIAMHHRGHGAPQIVQPPIYKPHALIQWADFVPPFCLTTAIVIRFIKTRAEIEEWNPSLVLTRRANKTRSWSACQLRAHAQSRDKYSGPVS